MPPIPSHKQTELSDVWNKLADKIRQEKHLLPKDCEATIKAFPNIAESISIYRRRLIGRDGAINGECVARILDNQGIPTKYRAEVASVMIMELTGNKNVG